MRKQIEVNSELVDCVGVEPQQCLEVREASDQDWRLFYDEVTTSETAPADASTSRYELVEVVRREPA